MTQAALLSAFVPLARAVAGADLASPDAAARLQAAVSPAELAALEAALVAAFEAGWLTPRTAPGNVKFGRLAKAAEATLDHTIDVVEMEGAGASHAHPRGEVSLAIARSGAPRFDGHPPGLVVLPPGSHHAPTVTGGRMLIAYLLPGGAIAWDG